MPQRSGPRVLVSCGAALLLACATGEGEGLSASGSQTGGFTGATSDAAASGEATTTGTATGGESTGDLTTTAATTAASASEGSSAASTGDPSSTATDDATTATPDLPGEVTVCDRVDVLLVIDASASMAGALASLPATFSEIKATLGLAVGQGIEDFHIAVINACPKPPYFHNYGAGDTDCTFPGGRNWLASSDPEVDADFACVSQVPLQDEALQGKGGGNGGYNSIPDTCSDGDDEDEQPAWTAAKALDPGVAVNAGFARDDAVLFVVAITDEDEALVGPQDADEIHAAIVATKGDPERVVFLGIGGDQGGCTGAYGGGEVKDSAVLREVADAFGERGLYRTMCAKAGDDPIGDAFDEALKTIVDDACTTFVP